MAEDQNIPQIPLLMPIKVESTNAHQELPHNSGEVVVIIVDEHGNEIGGSEFVISAKQFYKSYATNPKFQIKKNTRP